jgi:hypothetical protein
MDQVIREQVLNLYDLALSSPLRLILGVVLGYLLITTLIKHYKGKKTSFTNLTQETSRQADVSDVSLIEGEYYIKGSRGNKFCSDDPSGLICNKDFPSGFERFNLYYIPESKRHIIQGARGKFCIADQRFGLICNQDTPSLSASQFRIELEAYPTATPSAKAKIYQPVKIYANESLTPCADHGRGVMCHLDEDKGYDTFTLIPAAYIESTSMDAKFPQNERLLPITGNPNPNR